MNIVTTLFCLGFLGANQVSAANPGLILHTTQSAVQYGVNVSVQVLNQFINGFAIVPDQSGSFGIGTYTISNINVRQFDQPIKSTFLNFAAPRGLAFQTSEVLMQLAADYNITVKVPFIGDFSTHGQFSITASDIRFYVSADFSVDQTGHIIAHATSCNANVGKLAFHFLPGLDTILQALAIVIKPIINLELNQGLCRAMGLIVNKLVNPLLTSVPLTEPLTINFDPSLAIPPLRFNIDYSFLQNPVVDIAYAEAQCKGQVYAPGHQFDAGQPMAPPVTPVSDPPPSPLTGSMVVFQLSDYIINTFGFAANVGGLTSINITSASIVALGQSAEFLQTCCPAHSNCVGAMIPQICTMYPQGAVEVMMTSAAAPYGHTTSRGTTVSIMGYANFSVRLPNETAALLFRASVSTTEVVSNLRMNNYKVTAQVTTINPQLQMLTTNIGPVNNTQLQTAWTEAIASTWDGLLNGVVSSGLSLPNLPCFNIENGVFRSATNNVQVGVDIIFVGVNNCPYIPHAKKLFHQHNMKIIKAANV